MSNLDDLLQEEDESGDEVATAQPVNVSRPANNNKKLVQQLFGLLKQKITAEKFQELQLALQNCRNDQKQAMEHIRRIAGNDVFKAVLIEIRRPAAGVVADSTALGSDPTVGRSEKEEKMEQLLCHAAVCTIAPPGCPVALCGNIRKLLEHGKGCMQGAPQCMYCVKLSTLIQRHVAGCKAIPPDSCRIPGCAQQNLLLLGSAKMAPVAAMSMPTMPTLAQANSEEEDCRIYCTKPKDTSPKLTAVKSPKGSVNRSSDVSKAPTSGAAASGTAAPSKAGMSQLYGEILQIILHAKQCNASPCPFQQKCSEAKMLLSKMDEPNPPVRAKTYKQIWTHYQGCKKGAKCPVCARGASPLLSGSVVAEKPIVNPSFAGKRPLTPTGSNTSSQASKKARAALSRSTAKSVHTSASKLTGELVAVPLATLTQEGDVLRHTGVNLAAEKQKMLEGVGPTLDPRLRKRLDALGSKKEEWASNNLFTATAMARRIASVATKNGVSVGSSSSEYLSRALQDYIRQVLEELIPIAKHRCNVDLRKLEQMGRGKLKIVRTPSSRQLTDSSTDAEFTEIRQRDIDLRQSLYEQVQEEIATERERLKKKKKQGDRARNATENAETAEKPEDEMDVEELILHDMKKKLTEQVKAGNIVGVPGDGDTVNQAVQDIGIMENQVVPQDVMLFLRQQMPMVNPKIFCRAEVAMIGE